MTLHSRGCLQSKPCTKGKLESVSPNLASNNGNTGGNKFDLRALQTLKNSAQLQTRVPFSGTAAAGSSALPTWPELWNARLNLENSG